MLESLEAEKLWCAPRTHDVAPRTHDVAPRTSFEHVLVLVLGTLESTYQKAGAFALLSAEQVLTGMVSGGCLDADLVVRVEKILKNRVTGWYPLRYDTRFEEDSLLGSALGCKGCLDLALIPVSQVLQLIPFFTTSWSAKSLHHGNVSLNSKGMLEFFFTSRGSKTRDSTSFSLPCLDSGYLAEFGPFQESNFLVSIPKRKEIFIFGAGADAEPLVLFLYQMGYELKIVDHRLAYLESLNKKLEQSSGSFSRLCRVEFFLATHSAGSSGELILEELAHASGDSISGREFIQSTSQPALNRRRSLKEAFQSSSAAIVMSHHVLWDAKYLNALSFVDLGEVYIGLLGPEHRRKAVFRAACEITETCLSHPLDQEALHSPIGLGIGARGAAEIAVSIAAEITSFLRSK